MQYTQSLINVFELVKIYTDEKLVDRKRMHGKVKMNFHCLSVFIQLSHHLRKRQLIKHVGLYYLVCLSGELTSGQQPYR
jgi:hypothetical protein